MLHVVESYYMNETCTVRRMNHVTNEIGALLQI